MPGPTLRAREGERLRIRFVNGSAHPHTIHFHGIHPAAMDGVPGHRARGSVAAGRAPSYEFDAEPFGLHLYHCHVAAARQPHRQGPARRVHRSTPSRAAPEADELVMVMNGFDTNFDDANEVYAANTIAFAYMDEPIQVKRGELVRDLPGQHARVRPDQLVPPARATSSTTSRPARRWSPPSSPTRSCSARASAASWSCASPTTGSYMFHAHKSEFAELGWMGFFEVVD